MGAFQRFARGFLAFRDVDFLVVGVSLVAVLLAYQILPAVGGLIGRFPTLASTSSLSVLGLVLLLAFFGIALVAGSIAALRPGQLRGIPLRVAVGSTLLVQSLVGLFAAILAFFLHRLPSRVPRRWSASRSRSFFCSFALIDAWVAAGVASAFFRRPGHEGS